MELVPTDTDLTDSDIVPCDITNRDQVRETIRNIQPEVIINTAAFTNVDGNEREPERAELVNFKGVEFLLTAAEEVEARLIQISTDYVFDGTAGPYLEEDTPAPLSVYGKAKLAAERLVLENSRHLVIRTNVLFGPDLNAPASFIRWVASSLEEDKPIRVVDDQINNPTLTTHLAVAIKSAIEQRAAGLYHYAGLEFLTRYEFALRISHHFGLAVQNIKPITTKELGQIAPRPLLSGLICSKMKMDLKVNNTNITDALAEAFPRV
jgi:dTDP-4-dehydrorhamnose reductase